VSIAIRIDPEGNETDARLDLVEVEGREVLEIGCGDGRLTRRYADRPPTSRRSTRSSMRSPGRRSGSRKRRTIGSSSDTWPSRTSPPPATPTSSTWLCCPGRSA